MKEGSKKPKATASSSSSSGGSAAGAAAGSELSAKKIKEQQDMFNGKVAANKKKTGDKAAAVGKGKLKAQADKNAK